LDHFLNSHAPDGRQHTSMRPTSSSSLRRFLINYRGLPVEAKSQRPHSPQLFNHWLSLI